jgi:hypothetical protein
VTVIADLRHPYPASYGGGELILNKTKLGSAFFEEGILEKQIELGLHELAHDRVSNHLSDDFHEECCRLGAKFAKAVAQKKIFLDDFKQED